MLFFYLFCYVSYIVSLLNMFARHTFVWIGCATGDRRSAVWRHATQRFKTRASSAPVPGLLAVQWWDCKDMNRGGIKLELVQSPPAYTCSYLNGRERQERYFYSTRFATFQGCMNWVCSMPEHVLMSHRQLCTGLIETYLPAWVIRCPR